MSQGNYRLATKKVAAPATISTTLVPGLSEIELETIINISSLLIRQHDMQTALSQILQGLQKLVPCENSAIYYCAPGSTQICPLLINNLGHETLTDQPVPIHSSLVGLGVIDNQPYLFNNVVNDKRAYYLPHSDPSKPFALMTAPLLISPDGEGWLLVLRRRLEPAFKDREFSLFKIFANYASAAIENAHLFDRLHRTRRQWQMTLDVIPDMLLLVEIGNATILQINRAGAELVGSEPKKLVGSNFQALLGAVDPCLALIPYDKLTPETPGYSEEMVGKFSGRIYQRSLYPLFDSNGEFSEIVMHVRDITDTKFMQEKLTQATLLKKLGEMSSGVAHDFNNVLATILGNIELMLLEVDDPHLQSQLFQLKQAALDGSTTVRRIQAFGRRDSQSGYHVINLNQLAHEVIELTRPRWQTQMQRRGIHVQVVQELAETLPVSGNPAELREVITNLVFNALDAMPVGGTLLIRGYFEQDNNILRAAPRVVLEVRDSGTGMPLDVGAHVFEPFFTTKGRDGTGLGLSMVRQIITEHQGDITFESKLDEGTSFYIYLPQAVTVEALTEARKSGESSLPVTLITNSSTNPCYQTELLGELAMAATQVANPHCHILVIDDDPVLATILRRILKFQGHNVELAEGGRAGLEMFQRNGPFDMVFTDLSMPEISGYDVAHTIKELDKRVIVAFITGWGSELNRETLGASGVDFVIAKPYQIEEVTKLVQQAITLIKANQ